MVGIIRCKIPKSGCGTGYGGRINNGSASRSYSFRTNEEEK